MCSNVYEHERDYNSRLQLSVDEIRGKNIPNNKHLYDDSFNMFLPRGYSSLLFVSWPSLPCPFKVNS